MSLSAALSLAAMGFHVFPLIRETKLPAIDDFPNQASRGEERIRAWWTCPVTGWEQPYNIGISTSRFGDNEALIVVDVDNKGDKRGDDEILRLELQGLEFQPTFEQRTPTGGRHLVFRVDAAVKQGSNVLAPGIDIRSKGGFIVGAGSVTDSGIYTEIGGEVCAAPSWLTSRLKNASPRQSDVRTQKRGTVATVEPSRSASRAIDYLINHAPLAVQGDAGDEATFKVAARVKDFGCDEIAAAELMFERWNNRCSPPWSYDELKRKIENAYSYGQNQIGLDDPAAQFDPIAVEEQKTSETPHPFDKLNQEYAYVLNNGKGHILYETADEEEKFKLDHLPLEDFHNYLAAEELVIGGKSHPTTKQWMKSKKRRTYRGLCFKPQRLCSASYYNIWRGFSVIPLDKDDEPTPTDIASVNAWLEHAHKNICREDGTLFTWLISYCAHIVQKPWELPLVALVLRGGKGVGKSGWIERLGFLLGDSFVSTSKQDDFLGGFNSILENKILLVAEEAFWSGDKEAEGKIKDLITRQKHNIRRLYCEAYRVDNCLRLVIIGNEDWLVPASEDERRYAVFDVGDGRKQDRKFFKDMREQMESGGYRYLLRYLSDFKIPSHVDVSAAPRTTALLRQKERSLKPFHQWWNDCLMQGHIEYCGSEWPREVPTHSFRRAFREYWDQRKFKAQLPDDRTLGHQLKECCPNSEVKRARIEGERVQQYAFPSLADARTSWDRFIGHSNDWETDEEKEIFG